MAKMVFNEYYGEIPYTLNRLIKGNNVTPSDFATMEDRGFSHDDMIRIIREHSTGKRFNLFEAMEANGGFFR